MRPHILKVAAATLVLFFLLSPDVRAQTKKPDPEIAVIDRYVAELDRFIKKNDKKARIFADVSSDIADTKSRWQEFRTEAEREKTDTGENLNENAVVWLRMDKVVGANFTFQSPSRDWAHFVMYYFREDGTLAKIHAQLNTFFGDMTIIRDRYYSANGKLLRSSQRLLDLKTQKPKKSSDFQNEPIPVYQKTSQLPFRHLL